MKNKIYYKVVYKHNLRSARAPYNCAIEYKIGKFVKPTLPNSKLFVFNSLQKAKRFCSSLCDECIYKCEVKNPSIPKYMCRTIEHIQEFWIQRKNHKKISKIAGTILSGTIFCDEVKLLEKVVE